MVKRTGMGAPGGGESLTRMPPQTNSESNSQRELFGVGPYSAGDDGAVFGIAGREPRRSLGWGQERGGIHSALQCQETPQADHPEPLRRRDGYRPPARGQETGTVHDLAGERPDVSHVRVPSGTTAVTKEVEPALEV